jgi:hypothetical protein
LINAPVGLLALAGCYFLLREPDYLIAQRAELRKQPFRFDSIGLSLLATVIVCREVMLSKGQGVGLAGRSVLAHPDVRHLLYRGFGGLVFWEMRHRNRLVNFRPLGERNFAAASSPAHRCGSATRHCRSDRRSPKSQNGRCDRSGTLSATKEGLNKGLAQGRGAWRSFTGHSAG